MNGHDTRWRCCPFTDEPTGMHAEHAADVVFIPFVTGTFGLLDQLYPSKFQDRPVMLPTLSLPSS